MHANQGSSDRKQSGSPLICASCAFKVKGLLLPVLKAFDHDTFSAFFINHAGNLALGLVRKLVSQFTTLVLTETLYIHSWFPEDEDPLTCLLVLP